jgi:hypothetical protein
MVCRTCHGAPHALRGGWHVDIDDAERRQRVHYRVDDRWRRTDGAGLTAPLGAQRIVRAQSGVGREKIAIVNARPVGEAVLKARGLI